MVVEFRAIDLQQTPATRSPNRALLGLRSMGGSRAAGFPVGCSCRVSRLPPASCPIEESHQHARREGNGAPALAPGDLRVHCQVVRCCACFIRVPGRGFLDTLHLGSLVCAWHVDIRVVVGSRWLRSLRHLSCEDPNMIASRPRRTKHARLSRRTCEDDHLGRTRSKPCRTWPGTPHAASSASPTPSSAS